MIPVNITGVLLGPPSPYNTWSLGDLCRCGCGQLALIIIIMAIGVDILIKRNRGNEISEPAMADPAATTVAASSQQNPLSRKLNKILESNLDNDKETLEALEVLSGFLDRNTLQARRNLRSDLEKRSLALNEAFLYCIGQLVEQVQGLQQEANSMKACCEDMQQRLTAAKARTAGLLKETSELQAKNKQLEMKSKVVAAFLGKFELSHKELHMLTSGAQSTGGIGEEFFKTMARVKQIHEDCKVLLRTSQQRAGLEIMESMAMHLEAAYEQLYHWTQNQCRMMNTDLPEMNANLRLALKELRQRPILFQYCIDEFSIARRMALVRCFIDALTREGSSGRPIELHSHDPVRYCSDMLGWLHQAIATENDHIAGLLLEPNSDKAVSVLSMVTEGACRPLHVRVEQVIISTGDSVVAYQLVNLLRYYMGVFRGLLSPTAPLVQTVADLAELQSKMFFSTLNVQTSKILEGMEAPFPDLAPTTKASELLTLLQSIMASRDMTVLASDNQEQDLRLILSTCLDPLIQYCNEAVANFSRLDRAVYMINCLYLIQSTVSLYEFTERQLENLESQIQVYVRTVVSEQLSHLLGAGGLLEFHGALKVGKLSGEHFQGMEGCSERLRTLISAPDQFHLAQCKLLMSSRLREEVHQKAVSQFHDAYEAVYAALGTEKGAGSVSAVLPHTPEQIRQLLS